MQSEYEFDTRKYVVVISPEIDFQWMDSYDVYDYFLKAKQGIDAAGGLQMVVKLRPGTKNPIYREMLARLPGPPVVIFQTEPLIDLFSGAAMKERYRQWYKGLVKSKLTFKNAVRNSWRKWKNGQRLGRKHDPNWLDHKHGPNC